jgi:CHAT domain
VFIFFPFILAHLLFTIKKQYTMKTILIITANDPNDKLQMLAREGKDVQFLLNAAPRKSYDVVLLPETTTADIIKELNVPNREVEVLHYAGHADASLLRLNDTDAEATALADKLRALGTLKLVFINGCASKGQVAYFHGAGIPFVIATARPINDTKAVWVATQFYQYLSLGRSAREAFDEVVTDAKFQQKGINLANNRAIGHISDDKTVPFEWGLYTCEGFENSSYSLPFSAKMVSDTEGVNHSIFLDNLVFALAEVESPHFKNIKKLAENLRRGTVANGKKISELLKTLSYTLGVRIRQITAEPDDKSSEYYRELLYDYVFLYETLLHHTASVLIAQLWQNQKLALQFKPVNFPDIRAFWLKDQLKESPEGYKNLIVSLLDWLAKSGIENPYSAQDTEGMLAYFNAPQFEQATNYFHQQKRLFEQRVRLNEAESLENCFIAQQHLITAFQALKHVTAYFMASIRGINVVNFRHVATEYGNVVSKLVVTEADPTSVFGTKMLENKSILCYKSDESDLDALIDVGDTMNLFPFVIDRNVFTEKANSEVDLYLFTGYFADATTGRSQYHFASVQNPSKIWQFDETQNHVNLLHIGETAGFAHQANHLMANAGEFKAYLTEFKNLFLKP